MYIKTFLEVGRELGVRYVPYFSRLYCETAFLIDTVWERGLITTAIDGWRQFRDRGGTQAPTANTVGSASRDTIEVLYASHRIDGPRRALQFLESAFDAAGSQSMPRVLLAVIVSYVASGDVAFDLKGNALSALRLSNENRTVRMISQIDPRTLTRDNSAYDNSWSHPFCRADAQRPLPTLQSLIRDYGGCYEWAVLIDRCDYEGLRIGIAQPMERWPSHAQCYFLRFNGELWENRRLEHGASVRIHSTIFDRNVPQPRVGVRSIVHVRITANNKPAAADGDQRPTVYIHFIPHRICDFFGEPYPLKCVRPAVMAIDLDESTDLNSYWPCVELSYPGDRVTISSVSAFTPSALPNLPIVTSHL